MRCTQPLGCSSLCHLPRIQHRIPWLLRSQARPNLPPGECATVAKFYPPATARQVQDSLRNMALYIKLLATPEGPRRAVLRKGMGLLGPHVGKQLMTTGPNPSCVPLNQPLLEHYEQAVAAFPEMLSQLQAHLTYNGTLGEEFEKIFG